MYDKRIYRYLSSANFRFVRHPPQPAASASEPSNSPQHDRRVLQLYEQSIDHAA